MNTPTHLESLLQRLVSRFPLVRRIMRRFELGSLPLRISIGAVQRPHYAHILFNAARLAKKLGYESFSVIEYGVAGGNGLMALEEYASALESYFSIRIEIYGFDTGQGLPPPTDYRDLPYVWKEGFYRMDQAALSKKLKRSKLVLGDIHQTSKTFFDTFHPAPIGAMIHDFDFYTSTVVALKMLNADEKYFLPRLFCYFDDTIDDEVTLFNDFTGERLAISEFNEANPSTKLCKPYYFITQKNEVWHHQIWIAHLFKHSKYNDFIGTPNDQRPLRT